MNARGTGDQKRIEPKEDIDAYIARLQYALGNRKTKIQLQHGRSVDSKRPEKYTNRFTLSTLFPDDDPVEIMKRELMGLGAADYVETVKDTTFPRRSEMRVFGKKYSGEYVYIKIRVELLGSTTVFVMSFHYAERQFSDSDFPYAGK